jgi:hypothetical protein
MRHDPMSPVERLRKALRCLATSRRSRQQCRAPAEKGKRVCRFHGARAGAPTGTANGNYRHGGFTMEAMAERRALSKLLREARSVLARI